MDDPYGKGANTSDPYADASYDSSQTQANYDNLSYGKPSMYQQQPSPSNYQDDYSFTEQ